MAYSGVLDDIRKCVELKVPNRLPVFACSEEMDVRLAGMTYEDYCQSGELMAKCQSEVIRRLDYDWAWLQVDDCFEFEPLGVGVKGEGNILRATYQYLPFTREALAGLEVPDPKKDGRMPALLDGIKRVKDEFGDTVCVCGRTAGPFSSVTLIFGIAETMMMAMQDEELLAEATKFCADMQTQFGLAQIEAGADMIWFGDCNASGHMLSPDQYRAFAFESADRVAAEYGKAGAWTTYHASEENLAHIDIMADLSISILSVGPGVDIAEAKRACKGRMCLVGNVNPILTLYRGAPDDVRAETERIVRAALPGGGYICSSGEMVPRDTPEENMAAMIETARRVGDEVIAAR